MLLAHLLGEEGTGMRGFRREKQHDSSNKDGYITGRYRRECALSGFLDLNCCSQLRGDSARSRADLVVAGGAVPKSAAPDGGADPFSLCINTSSHSLGTRRLSA